MEIKGKNGTTFEILHEMDLQSAFTGHSTSLTCSFVVKPKTGEAFPLYLWYPIVALIAEPWSDEQRWKHAREQVKKLLKAQSSKSIREARQKQEDLGSWEYVEDADGWKKRGLKA